MVTFLILVAQIGLRWEMGTDWTPYRNHFEQEHSWESVLLNVTIGFELGYGLFVWLINTISKDYTVFLLIHALIFYALIFKASNQLSKYPILTLLLFYAATIGLTGSNRQLLALAICLYSLKYVVNKKLTPFLFCVSVATLFHTSALLFSIYYLLNRDLKNRTIFLLLTLSVFIGLSSIPAIAFDSIAGFLGGTISQKAEYYIKGSSIAGADLSVLGLLRRILVLIIGLYMYQPTVRRVPTFRIFFNGYLVGLILYFLFSHSLLILVNRGSLYFSVMEAFILASIIVTLKDNLTKIIALGLLIAYTIVVFNQSISAYPDLFIPYQGIFINTEYHRNLY
ncbi:hypothetical protein PI93_023550 [Pandoraea fibrosis]|uniref:EpsG family protein n=1 Tax=Pandoraea fibrosis TaxID=1891094 RepID=A0ABX6HWK6_9BURK|nr:EpsG family protein [Pandoraea fibrosis]QHE94451.1 hypothetical protein PJ20_023545 [Pandoraea fibrosis]QHF15289.1 hypothetical protein PI93_023550 [Pandoraea fibrosis]